MSVADQKGYPITAIIIIILTIIIIIIIIIIAKYLTDKDSNEHFKKGSVKLVE